MVGVAIRLQPAKLVFLKQTGANTKMARLRGRSARGERCRENIPHGHWKTTTRVAGLRYDGVTAPGLIDGTRDGDTFALYAVHFLTPTLSVGDIVMLENLPAHKVTAARVAVEAIGPSMLFLPA